MLRHLCFLNRPIAYDRKKVNLEVYTLCLLLDENWTFKHHSLINIIPEITDLCLLGNPGSATGIQQQVTRCKS